MVGTGVAVVGLVLVLNMNGTVETLVDVAMVEKLVSFAISNKEPTNENETTDSAVESLQIAGSKTTVFVAFVSRTKISFVSKPDPVNKMLLPVLIM